jgi:hypothetical protein
MKKHTIKIDDKEPIYIMEDDYNKIISILLADKPAVEPDDELVFEVEVTESISEKITKLSTQEVEEDQKKSQ